MIDLVGNQNCWFSHAHAHIIVFVVCLTRCYTRSVFFLLFIVLHDSRLGGGSDEHPQSMFWIKNKKIGIHL